MLTLGEIRKTAITRQHASPTPALDADLLITDALGCDRAWLLAHLTDPLSEADAAHIERHVQRAAAGEPIAYILGRRGFYDLDLIVTPDVLIPRPETELLLEEALRFCADRPSPTVADIGTGSGALAVTFAVHKPDARVYAVDVSEAALAVARRNAEHHQVDERITFLHGDLLSPLIERDAQIDVLMANLPYIPADVVPTLEVSAHEPVLALDGGADGLALIRRLLDDAPKVCPSGALILLEMGFDQGERVRAMAATLKPHSVEILRDYAGMDRIARIHLA